MKNVFPNILLVAGLVAVQASDCSYRGYEPVPVETSETSFDELSRQMSEVSGDFSRYVGFFKNNPYAPHIQREPVYRSLSLFRDKISEIAYDMFSFRIPGTLPVMPDGFATAESHAIPVDRVFNLISGTLNRIVFLLGRVTQKIDQMISEYGGYRRDQLIAIRGKIAEAMELRDNIPNQLFV
jgi:hypothetical protein